MRTAEPLQDGKNRSPWDERCKVMVRRVHKMMQEFQQFQEGSIDWLSVAVGNLGGPRRAAKILGQSPQNVYRWLNDGLTGADFAVVVKLSERGGVPLEYLARRLGSFDYAKSDDADL